MSLTAKQLSFRRSFYSQVKEKCAFVSFADVTGDLSGNRIDYNRIDDSLFAGTVNCYFRSTEIEKYGGNICVAIRRKYMNDNLLKALYDKRHTKLTSRQFVISTNTKSLSAAVSWACKILQTHCCKQITALTGSPTVPVNCPESFHPMAIPDFSRGIAIVAKRRLLITSPLAFCAMAIPTPKTEDGHRERQTHDTRPEEMLHNQSNGSRSSNLSPTLCSVSDFLITLS